MVFFVPCLSLHNLNKLICAMMLLLSYRRDDAATINRIVRRQATGIEGQRKGVSNHLQNCTNEFEIFIDPMTTHATIHGDRRTQNIFFYPFGQARHESCTRGIPNTWRLLPRACAWRL